MPYRFINFFRDFLIMNKTSVRISFTAQSLFNFYADLSLNLLSTEDFFK